MIHKLMNTIANKRSYRETAIEIILDVEDTNLVVTHKCNSKLLMVEYCIDHVTYVEKVLAKYIDPLDLDKLEVNKRIEICYDLNNPKKIYLPYYSGILQLFK